MSKQKHNQQGIAHPALILILVVVIAVVGFAAYRVTGKTNNTTATTTTNVSSKKVATTSLGGNCGTETLDAADFNTSVSATSSTDGTSSNNSKSGLTIANKCFNASFKACKAASLMAVANFTVDGTKADEQTDYVITGSKTGGCEVKQTYTKSTILPANLVGTDLVCTLDNTVIFTDALNKVANDSYKGCTGSFMEKSGA